MANGEQFKTIKEETLYWVAEKSQDTIHVFSIKHSIL